MKHSINKTDTKLLLSKETLAHLKVSSSVKAGVQISNGNVCSASNKIHCII